MCAILIYIFFFLRHFIIWQPLSACVTHPNKYVFGFFDGNIVHSRWRQLKTEINHTQETVLYQPIIFVTIAAAEAEAATTTNRNIEYRTTAEKKTIDFYGKLATIRAGKLVLSLSHTAKMYRENWYVIALRYCYLRWEQ